MLVEGGHEHDMAASVDLLRHLEPRQPRHLDVQEQDVGLLLLERAQRLDAVFDESTDP